MSTDSSNFQAAVEAAAKLVQILLPLNSGERKRAITAAMVLLGDSHEETVARSAPTAQVHSSHPQEGISAKASGWMKKHGITRDQLEQIFSIEADSIEVIAAQMPGASKRRQTVDAYIICGLRALLQVGEPNFTDKDARAICVRVGCYDTGNHSNYINALGNLVGGTKDVGWKLTNPGLGRAAEIVKQLAPNVTT